MLLGYTIILFVLIIILFLTLREEIMSRKGIIHGRVNKYWILREKRKYVRFDEDLKIRYNRIGIAAPDTDIRQARTQNISRKGLCISSYEKLSKKDSLEVEIEVPGFSRPVKILCTVIWVKELRSIDDLGRRIFYTGIRFSRIDPESEAILITHLNTLRRP